jgi:hypothetical protein
VPQVLLGSVFFHWACCFEEAIDSFRTVQPNVSEQEALCVRSPRLKVKGVSDEININEIDTVQSYLANEGKVLEFMLWLAPRLYENIEHDLKDELQR